MIDYSLRNKMILEQAADPDVSVLLLDVVLGHGANLDPAGELVPVIKKAARQVFVVVGVTLSLIHIWILLHWSSPPICSRQP